MSDRVTALISGLVFVLMGGGFAAVPVVMQAQINATFAGAPTTQGEVIGLQEQSTGDSNDVYRPIIRFTSASGDVYEFADPTGENPPRFHVGDSVEIVYVAHNPAEARVLSFTNVFTNPLWLMFLVIGGLVLVVGALIVIRSIFPS